jgi:hypothetical protein
VMTKAGAFGDGTTILRSLERLRQRTGTAS